MAVDTIRINEDYAQKFGFHDESAYADRIKAFRLK